MSEYAGSQTRSTTVGGTSYLGGGSGSTGLRRRKKLLKNEIKLARELKLYIFFYFIAFLLTWLVSIPMLIHVVPDSECLLFVSPFVKYGNPLSCHFVGIMPILVGIASLVLVLFHVVQLRSLKDYQKHKLSSSLQNSASLKQREPHIFWKLIFFHSSTTFAVLLVAVVSTAGYVTTCQNLSRDVKKTISGRLKIDKWGTGRSRIDEQYDKYADGQSINRYTNPGFDTYTNNFHDFGITCRNVLTDPELHSRLKRIHFDNPLFFGSYGNNENLADIGDIRYLSYRNNLVLELCLAGSWISFALWSLILLLMLKERLNKASSDQHHSIVGSDYGHRKEAGSRMSTHDFDRISDRGSRMNQERFRLSQTDHHYLPPTHETLSKHEREFYQKKLVPVSSSGGGMMNYFSHQKSSEVAVDVDEAIHKDISYVSSDQCVGLEDTYFNDSFDSGPLPSMLEPITPNTSTSLRASVLTPERMTGRRGGVRRNSTPVRQNIQPEFNYLNQTDNLILDYSKASKPHLRTHLGNQSMI